MTQPSQCDCAAKERAGKRFIRSLLIIVALAVAIGLLAGGYLDPWLKHHILYKEVVFSGVYDYHPLAVQFSPDSKTVAYLHHETKSLRARYHGPERTLSDAVELRWRPVGNADADRSIKIDSIELGPEEEGFWVLQAHFRFSPDSRRLAAVCGKKLVVVDVATGDHNDFEFGANWPSDVAWLSNDEVVLVTDDTLAWTFSRWRVDEPTSSRQVIHKETYRDVAPPPTNQLRLEFTGRFEFSPDGKSVLFRRFGSGRGEEVLLSLETGAATPLATYIGSHSWKPDGSALMVDGATADDEGDVESFILLVDPRSGNVIDLTEQFAASFDDEASVSLIAPRWLPDGEHLLVRSIQPEQVVDGKITAPSVRKDHLVRVNPWQVVMTREEMLYWSPVSNAVLVGDEDGLMWLAYDGEALGGWAGQADRIWSPNGHLAAWVDDGEVSVFDTTVSPAEP